MDFKSIIASTKQYNFHSHTQFCDGHADMDTMARAAVACGMRHYGFTPHSPIPIESPCNMSADSVEEFMAEVKRLQSLPELASCRFYTGMEIDWLGKEWGPHVPYFRNLGLDYSIASVHFIQSQDGDFIDIDGSSERFARRMSENFRKDIEYVVHTFYEQSKEMINAGGFDILGHFDKVGHNASHYAPGILDSSFYAECIDPVVDLIIEKGLTLELNTKARAEHRFFFPGPRYLARLVAAGNTILVNSDAHRPDRITASRDEAFDLIDNLRHADS